MGWFTESIHICGDSNHFFEPRYSTSSIIVEELQVLIDALDDYPDTYDIDCLADSLKSKTYICDVCKYCGRTTPH